MQYNVYKTKKEASMAAFELMKKNLSSNVTLGLATGDTPRDLYKAMIEDYNKGGFSYKDVKSFNLDEYVGISYEHPESYHKFMEANLFDHIDIKKENTHVPDASAENLEKAIANYQNLLDNSIIDIQVLGVGSNGHIGFNEPNTPFDIGVHLVDLKEETILANSRFFDNNIDLVPKQAVTMGINDIMKAKMIILLAFGKNKKQAIKELLSNLEVSTSIPCTVLKQHANLHIFVDEEADYQR
ncbi:glucosamine-6-phosphate deaminase [Gemella sp. zg-1178]|uniref:glucosamine-6-phosphate deaminase n=1 Tax=Gemella sp. zg-1178 TaxID=2840372 RepID=UPI001C05DB2D|nr:glucosamine-6-phosphate deaminase [Gemella sp. zg-1178]MBU0278217.1 glucosamine-6-phosphate deaminase [Gemella sp. zg-1178]